MNRWISGLISCKYPMGRLNYLFSNIVANFLLYVAVFMFTYILVRFFGIDKDSIKILVYVIFIPIALYIHFNLMVRRLWHISEDKSSAGLHAFVLIILELIPIIRILAIPVTELFLLLKPGCALPDNELNENN